MKLSTIPNKNIEHDIKVFEHKLSNRENFTFSKYADGEWAVMQNKDINNREFWFDSKNALDGIKRKQLIDSFKYKNPNYFVGVSCPCCQGVDTHMEMRKYCGQDEGQVTWANLWVNNNYSYFLSNILPIFQYRNVVLFCNEKSKVDNLPFKPKHLFKLASNSWSTNYTVIQESKTLIHSEHIQDYVFLFCCGPFGNILAYELTKDSPNNTYLDIGSTLNPFLQSEGFVRDYYVQGSFFSTMKCNWNNEQ